MPSQTIAAEIHVFGVRHLSPSGAWHLRRFLDEIRPDVVLIEGLCDANDLIPDITRRGSIPPIAILAYTDSLPVRTLVYPIARYSPEYQALVWAHENKATAQFIDLPSDVFLGLQEQGDAPDEQPDESNDQPSDKPQEESPPGQEQPVSIYDRFAEHAGELNYETYWERNFEHNLSDESYRLAAFEFGRGLRELEEETPRNVSENLVREAFMRRRIQQTIDAGHSPEKIVAVVGAYHASALSADREPMSDDEFESLARRSSKLTLMPYSYFKLSSQSGYGAGNRAPAYFELLWDSLERNDLQALATRLTEKS